MHKTIFARALRARFVYSRLLDPRHLDENERIGPLAGEDDIKHSNH